MKKSTKTHCKVPNVFPSMSAIIAGFEPQRFVWRLSFALTSVPRYFIAYLQLQRLLNRSHIAYRELYRWVQLINSLIHTVELTFLLQLTYISSNENKRMHEYGYLGFAVCSSIHMLGTILIDYYWPRMKKICLNERERACRRKRLKWFLFNFVSLTISLYFFYRHNRFCEPFIYSGYCLFEYFVILTNISYHSIIRDEWDQTDGQVLLMGKSGGGKTSMRSIIFANYSAKDTRRLGATMDVEQSYVRFLGNLILNLWDCGGQEAFMESYFATQKDNIFKNVEVLIYVFDVQSQEIDKDLHYYQSCLESILQHSSNAKIFCLIHKMDLIPEEIRTTVFAEREQILKDLSKPLQCACFRTSIWDETLYKAWSQIVYQLVPNVKGLEKTLENFAEIIDADEILLFEKATFLVISHCTRKEHHDSRRFEKISDIIKQFKLSCSKLAAAFQSMEVRNSTFACFIELCTPNTYVMVVISDPTISSEVTLMNIRNARKVFEKLEKDGVRS
ncbi:unnamed protein product [Adineta ricciae]|nr:unnamed protein product [Adineta ricciae]